VAAAAAEEEDKRFRVVIVTSELAPYSKSGGLADVCRSLLCQKRPRNRPILGAKETY
jgi:hypothetical protein